MLKYNSKINSCQSEPTVHWQKHEALCFSQTKSRGTRGVERDNAAATGRPTSLQARMQISCLVRLVCGVDWPTWSRRLLEKAIVGTPTAEEVEVKTRLRGVAGRGLVRDWVEVARVPLGPHKKYACACAKASWKVSSTKFFDRFSRLSGRKASRRPSRGRTSSPDHSVATKTRFLPSYDRQFHGHGCILVFKVVQLLTDLQNLCLYLVGWMLLAWIGLWVLKTGNEWRVRWWDWFCMT